MDKHIGFVAALSIGLGSLSLFIGVGALVSLLVIGALAIDEPLARTIAFIVGPILGSVVALIAATGIVGGIGLLKRRMWGRTLTMAYAVLSLMSIPIGTAFGVYALWVLMQEDTITILKAGPDMGHTPDISAPIDRAA